MFPLVYQEIDDFDLDKYLLIGGLPNVYPSEFPFEELSAYTGTYLREEIQAEAAVQSLEPFAYFLDLMATRSGEEINFQALASDCGVSPKTIRNYIQLLDDTLVGFLLPPLKTTIQRKATSRAKFYLFDTGVSNSLCEIKTLSPMTQRYGQCFEHFILLELRAYLSYRRLSERLSFWKSQSGFEVDIIVGNKLAIEVKSSELIHSRHLHGLKALKEERVIDNFCVVSRDPEQRIVEDIKIYPWRVFLKKLWSDKLL